MGFFTVNLESDVEQCQLWGGAGVWLPELLPEFAPAFHNLITQSPFYALKFEDSCHAQ